jgi:hypothetical protein
VDNNPWHCDCKLKDLLEYISEQDSAFSGFTCREPLTYENLSWNDLRKLDCRTSTARNVKEIVEKPTSMLHRSSFYSTSAVTDVTEETAKNIHMPTSTTPLDTWLAAGWIVAIVLMIIIVLVILRRIVAHIRKRRRTYEQTRENTGALLSGNDEQRVQDSKV